MFILYLLYCYWSSRGKNDDILIDNINSIIIMMMMFCTIFYTFVASSLFEEKAELAERW